MYCQPRPTRGQAFYLIRFAGLEALLFLGQDVGGLDVRDMVSYGGKEAGRETVTLYEFKAMRVLSPTSFGIISLERVIRWSLERLIPQPVSKRYLGIRGQPPMKQATPWMFSDWHGGNPGYLNGEEEPMRPSDQVPDTA